MLTIGAETTPKDYARIVGNHAHLSMNVRFGVAKRPPNDGPTESSSASATSEERMPFTSRAALETHGRLLRIKHCASLSPKMSQSTKWSTISKESRRPSRSAPENSGSQISCAADKKIARLFQQALKRATASALSFRLAIVNAEQIAADAVEDAWFEITQAGGDIETLPDMAHEAAKKYSRREYWNNRTLREFADEYDGDDAGDKVTIAVEPLQELWHALFLQLGQVQRAFEKLGPEDCETLRLLLAGCGVLEIARATKRAVPVIVASLEHIRSVIADG